MTTEPIPADCLPFDGNDARLLELLRGPKVGPDGTVQGGLWDGMTPDDVLAQRERYRRIVGE